MSANGASKLRLLVEGQADLFAIAHLIGARFEKKLVKVNCGKAEDDAVFIKQHTGVTNLLKNGVISAAAKTHERLGIVVDANGAPGNRWKAVGNQLESAKVALSSAPVPGGTVVPGFRAGWKVGVWLMPDNINPGALEDFLVPLIPSSDVLWPLAQSSTERAEATERRYGSTDELKARLWCWLAWQKDPQAGVGPALSAGVLNPLHSSADAFAKWWDDLFA